MNREIKFRAWDKEKKEWYKPIHEAYKGNLSELMLGFKGDILEHNINGITHESVFPDRYELNQYTGLKDKNGVEIYEGDICRVDHKHKRYEVSEDNVIEWDNEDACWTFGCGSPTEVHWSHEVIGNIYQNPELLN